MNSGRGIRTWHQDVALRTEDKNMLKKLLFLLVCGICLVHAQETPILRNGSFEELDEKGYPKYWTNKSPEWQSSDKVASSAAFPARAR